MGNLSALLCIPNFYVLLAWFFFVTIAIRLDPNNIDLIEQKANLLLDVEEYKKALECFEIMSMVCLLRCIGVCVCVCVCLCVHLCVCVCVCTCACTRACG